MRRTNTIGLLVTSATLACGGLGPDLPPECEAPPLPRGRVTSPTENADATPAWAPGFLRSVAAVDVGDPPVRVPQPHHPPPADAATPDGGPLVCSWTTPAERGLPVASVTLSDGTLFRVAFEGRARSFAIPAFSDARTAHFTAAVAKTECSGVDPFWLLLAGFPIPKCRSSERSLADDDASWDGGYTAGPLTCRAMSRAAADEAVTTSLSLLAGDVRSICVTRQQGLGLSTLHVDDGKGNLMDAAALVGWADPRVAASVVWFEQIVGDEGLGLPATGDTRRRRPKP